MPTDTGTITDHLAAGQPAFAVATRVGDYAVQRPFFPEDPAALIITAPYWQERASYAPPAKNSTNPDFPGSYFCGDSTPDDLGMGLCQFTRTWATIPAAGADYESYAASFPGLSASAGDERRYPFIRPVTSQLTLAYFLVGPGGAYATPADIPVVAATSFRYSTDLVDRPPDNIFLGTVTTPTASAWVTSVTTAAFTYVVEPSFIRRHVGNIWCRVTRKVRPL